MSFATNHLTITNLVINTVPNNGMAVPPATIAGLVPAANGTSWTKMQEDLAQGNKFQEEKLDTKASQPIGSSPETKGDNKQPPDNVMQKVGTTANYPVPSQETLSQNKDESDASLGQATPYAVQAKRDCRQVLLDLLYHFIETRNLAGLYQLKASEELNRTLRNMIEMAILEILRIDRHHAVTIAMLLALLCPIGFLLVSIRLNCDNLFRRNMIFTNLSGIKRTVTILKLDCKRNAAQNSITNLKGH